MPIPENIEREHIFQAMLKVKREGIPAKRGHREWAVLYENEIYPCKLLISWANIYANGQELDPDPSNFNTYLAQDYLSSKQFEIVPV
ncbi:MAG: hypothetical protein ACTHMD_10540 [Flavisolibacter sp.]